MSHWRLDMAHKQLQLRSISCSETWAYLILGLLNTSSWYRWQSHHFVVLWNSVSTWIRPVHTLILHLSKISQFKPVYSPDYTGRLKHKYYVILLMSNIWKYFSWHLTIIKVKLHVVWSFAYVCCPPHHVYTCSPLRVKNRYRGAAYVNGYDISLKIYKSPLLFSVLCYCDRNSCYNDANTVEGHIILQRHRLNSHSI